MIRSWLSGMSVGVGPMVVTVGFLVFFVGVLVWIFRPGSTRAYDQLSTLPLNDGAPAAKAGKRNHG